MMVSEVGDDRVGDIVTRFLGENNVQTDYVYRHEGTQSHISLAFLNERNDANYQFYKMHNALNMPPHYPEINRGDIVLFGSYFAINPKVRAYVSEFLRMANEAGAIIYYDINFRASHLKDLPVVMPYIIENMRLSTIVRGSSEDFSILFGCDDAAEVYERHVSQYCELFLYTDADKPVQVFTPQFFSSHVASKIKTVSTIGAGDNFNAGFCYGIMDSGVKDAEDMRRQSAIAFSHFVSVGMDFSSDVCQSYDNYVSHEFAQQLRSRK